MLINYSVGKGYGFILKEIILLLFMLRIQIVRLYDFIVYYRLMIRDFQDLIVVIYKVDSS